MVKNKKEFRAWYIETQKKIDSELVIQAVAADLIGISRQYLNDLIRNGIFKKYDFEDRKFLSFKDISEYIVKNNK